MKNPELSLNNKILFSIALGLLVLAGPGQALSQAVIPLPAHSHNDYEQPRPLFSALQLRFASIEADVFLVGDTLLVGHEESELMPGRTLGNLYLEPLRLLAMRNAGQIYSETTEPLILLVDVKTDAEATYKQLDLLLTLLDLNLKQSLTQVNILGGKSKSQIAV